ncbi:MAG: type II CAAX prenyl endopeptidase Rce1 family protein [Legionellales bacterium]
MMINWMLVGFLLCVCLPGVCIVMPRIINLLLQDNSEHIKKRFSYLAQGQSMVMVLVMSITGSLLSHRTGLQAPILEAFLQGKGSLALLTPIGLPTLIGALIALGVFCFFYYGVAGYFLDEQSLKSMSKLRASLGLSGCVLYGGVVDEVIARWGLMNLSAFFLVLFVNLGNRVYWLSIVISGLLFAIGQIPAYIAAGCVASRRFLYLCIVLSMTQSLVFGYLFWHYGLLSAMLAHMLFHLGWGVFHSQSVIKP